MIKPVNDFNIDAACYGNHDFVIPQSQKIKYLLIYSSGSRP